MIDINSIKDEDLVLLARQKGEKYFNHLLVRYFNYALKVLHEIGTNTGCKKILNDEGNYIYVDAMNRAVNDYVFGIVPFRFYFAKILARTTLNFLKKEKAEFLLRSSSLDNSIFESSTITFSDVTAFSDKNSDPKLKINASDVLNKIGEEIGDKRNTKCMQEIITLRLKGYTASEIAVITGYNSKTVRNIISTLKGKIVK